MPYAIVEEYYQGNVVVTKEKEREVIKTQTLVQVLNGIFCA